MTELKQETNREKVVKLHKEHLEWSSERIAKEIGVTKQRVHKIRKDLGLPTKMKREKAVLYCKRCNSQINTSLYNSKVYCSDECKFGNKVVLKCDNCSKDICFSKVSLQRLISRGWSHFYCCRHCYYEGRKKITREKNMEEHLNLVSPSKQT